MGMPVGPALWSCGTSGIGQTARPCLTPPESLRLAQKLPAMALTERDRGLLKRCLSQQPGAWRDFVDRFIGLFVHVIRHTARSRTVEVTAEDVDDLCSEIFVTLLQDDFAVLRNFRGESALATYLTVVGRRVVVRELIRRRQADALGHTEAHYASTASAMRPPGAARIEDQEEVRAMLDGLASADAEIVRQFHLQGKSYREISESLGIPENTIGPTLSRAESACGPLSSGPASEPVRSRTGTFGPADHRGRPASRCLNGFCNCHPSSKKSASTIFPGQRESGMTRRSTTAQSGSFGACRALFR